MDAHSSLWCGRRVLVTGCTGLLGSALTRELLARGAVVVGLVRDRSSGAEFAREPNGTNFRPVHGRVEDTIRLHSAMAVHEVSAVFHLARTDVFGQDRGTAAVLRAAALHYAGVPVVTARPSGELRLVTDEDAPSSVPVGVARFGELFGSGDRKLFRVVSRTVSALSTGGNATAPDGPVRDYVFVHDAARACLLLAEAVGARGESLDCTFRSGWELTERALARAVEEVFRGRTPDTPVQPVTNPLGWHPAASLAAALGETVAWYRQFHRAPITITRDDTRKAA
jgi:CDP-glucose 4,6-dehydratase